MSNAIANLILQPEDKSVYLDRRRPATTPTFATRQSVGSALAHEEWHRLAGQSRPILRNTIHYCLPHGITTLSEALTFHRAVSTTVRVCRRTTARFVILSMSANSTPPNKPEQFATATKVPTPEELAALPHDNGAAKLNGVIWMLTGVSGGFLALRIYCKFLRRKGLWWDDIILIAAWVRSG